VTVTGTTGTTGTSGTTGTTGTSGISQNPIKPKSWEDTKQRISHHGAVASVSKNRGNSSVSPTSVVHKMYF